MSSAAVVAVGEKDGSSVGVEDGVEVGDTATVAVGEEEGVDVRDMAAVVVDEGSDVEVDVAVAAAVGVAVDCAGKQPVMALSTPRMSSSTETWPSSVMSNTGH